MVSNIKPPYFMLIEAFLNGMVEYSSKANMIATTTTTTMMMTMTMIIIMVLTVTRKES